MGIVQIKEQSRSSREDLEKMAPPRLDTQRTDIMRHLLGEAFRGGGSEVVRRLQALSLSPAELAPMVVDCPELLSRHGLVGLNNFLKLDPSVPPALPRLDAIIDQLPYAERGILRALSPKNTAEACRLFDLYDSYLLDLGSGLVLTAQDLGYLSSSDAKRGSGIPLSVRELNALVGQRGHVASWETPDDFAALHSRLGERTPKTTFCRTCAVFGPAAACTIVRHFSDSILESIIKLPERSGHSASHIFNRVVLQVLDDQSTYEHGIFMHADSRSAKQEFGHIISNCNIDSAGKLLESQEVQKLPELKGMAEQFSNRSNIFASWTTLKAYAELDRLVKDPPLLKALVTAKQESPLVYAFAAPIYFKPGSRVAKEKILEFLVDPEAFMASFDTDHTWRDHGDKRGEDGRTLQDSITPKAMVDGATGGLDLSSRELQAAFLDGTLQKLSPLVPLRIDYRCPVSHEIHDNVASLLRHAIGTRSEGIAGAAQDPLGVFHAVKKVLGSKDAVLAYLKGAAAVTAEQEEALTAIAYDPKIGLREQMFEVRVELHAINDPVGATSADALALCDRFGSGKKNIFMFDPNSAAFTVQVKDPSGEWRVVAQSTVYHAMETETEYERVRKEFWGPSSDAYNVFCTESLHYDRAAVLGFDNVELSNNFSSYDKATLVRRLYEDFLAAYLSRFAKARDLNPSIALMGAASNGSTIDRWERSSSNYAPRTAPVGYTDWRPCYDGPMRRFEPSTSLLPLPRTITVGDEGTGGAAAPITASAITPLHYSETLGAAWVSGAHAKRTGNRYVSAQKMRTTLMSVAINNQQKGRPELSFKSTDKNRQITGILVAYEGKDLSGAGTVFLRHLATTAEDKSGKDRLLKRFAEAYRQAYGPRGPQIVVELSHKDQRRLVKALRRAGVESTFRQMPEDW